MTRSACLCGKVTWQIEGPLQFMSHCHCSRCRKAHGTAFATFAAGAADGFELNGQEHVHEWESSPGFKRRFCSHCGSVVPGDPWEALMFVPAGNFLDDPIERPAMHVFVASKAPWYGICDSLPRFDAYPPGFDTPALESRPLPDPQEGARGSCNCGGVRFVVEGKALGAWNCHCLRCRKARSAAHASNLFVTADKLRFVSGADRIGSYKVPEALRFTQSFCRVCGSKTPHLDPSRDRAGIPMGSFDDPPPCKPMAHIFVGSKAPWFEISDTLPQHEEYPPGS